MKFPLGIHKTHALRRRVHVIYIEIERVVGSSEFSEDGEQIQH